MAEGSATWDDPGLGRRLATTRFGEVRWFATLDSTNRYLLDAGGAGALAGLVAVADHQLAGRGRLGRTWEAPRGASLLVSVLLRPRLPPREWHLLTVTAALAAGEAVADLAGVRALLKWPNDLVVGDRKLAGLLAEARAGAVVVGMGCNVAWGELPASLAPIATSLDREAGVVVDRRDLLVAWLVAYDAWLARLEGGDAEAVRVAAAARSATLGRRVRVELLAEVLEGTAVGLGVEGHLVVETASGPREVSAGDVVHLRRADDGPDPVRG